MADKRIINYIKEHLQAGHSLGTIKRHLLVHNHNKTEVEECISKVNEDYENNDLRPN